LSSSCFSVRLFLHQELGEVIVRYVARFVRFCRALLAVMGIALTASRIAVTVAGDSESYASSRLMRATSASALSAMPFSAV